MTERRPFPASLAGGTIPGRGPLIQTSWNREEWLLMNTQRQMQAEAPAVVQSPHALIASDRVEGTNVYRPSGDKIGHIERIMIDKVTGRAAYAVMNFGGFLGLAEDSYPLPWSVLTYNPKLGGYEVNVTDEQLKGAPRYRPG